MEFASCCHAGPLLAPQLRACRSPRLIGLKQVTPGTCLQCCCRNHGDDDSSGVSSARLVDCLYLGAPQDLHHSANGSPGALQAFSCLHSNHRTTTLAHCESCVDYQFSILSPQMSVPDVRRIRSQTPREQPHGWWQWPNVHTAEQELADEFLGNIPDYPGGYTGRGIVVVGGGKYFPSAYVTVRVLRHVGCRLPIELWHLAGELTGPHRQLLEPWGVETVDADARRCTAPYRFLDGHWWKGWQLKPYAAAHSAFREVLLLDADCYPVRDPESVFDWTEYRSRGAIFWPDIESSMILLTRSAVGTFGVEEFDDRPAESGQLVINKEQCWRELNLALHLNAQADFTYNILWGDKDTFPIAWKRLGTDYARMHHDSRGTPHGIQQFDQFGDVLFQHRCTSKFTLDSTAFHSTPGQLNQPAPCEFALEGFCQSVLQELRELSS